MEEACRIIIEDIINGKITTRRELEVEKRQLCRDRNLKKFMSNSVILEHASLEEKKIVSNLLRKKPTRTISGVAIVAVMCHPHQCPHALMEDAIIALKVTLHLQVILERSLQHLEEECLSSIHMSSATIV